VCAVGLCVVGLGGMMFGVGLIEQVGEYIGYCVSAVSTVSTPRKLVEYF
jgi:hypothetical protein